MRLLFRIWKKRRLFVYFFPSLFFNFHYLPFWQAIKLPILLYKPELLECRGTVRIEAQRIKFGMIQLGFRKVSIFPNSGVMWENKGGEVIFKGQTIIGNDTYLSFGENTKVEIGDNFVNQAGLKLVSWCGIKFGNNERFGWGCLIMDTNIHPLYDMEKNKFKRASGPIEIGDNNWFGTGCKIMHSV